MKDRTSFRHLISKYYAWFGTKYVQFQKWKNPSFVEFMSQLPKVSSEELLRREEERKRKLGVANALETLEMYFDWRVGEAKQATDYDRHLINLEGDSEAESRKSVQILKNQHRMSFANKMAEQAFTFRKQKGLKANGPIDCESLHTSIADSVGQSSAPQKSVSRSEQVALQKRGFAFNKKPIYARENDTDSDDDSIQQIDDVEMLQLDPNINYDFKLGPVEKPDYLVKLQQQQQAAAETAEKKSEGSDGAPKEQKASP